MLYCNDCADERGWPKTMFKSRGACEICRKVTACNELPSNQLPPAEKTCRDLNQQELEQVPDDELVQRFEDMLRQGTGPSYNGFIWAINELLHRLRCRHGITRMLITLVTGKRCA